MSIVSRRDRGANSGGDPDDTFWIYLDIHAIKLTNRVGFQVDAVIRLSIQGVTVSSTASASRSRNEGS